MHSLRRQKAAHAPLFLQKFLTEVIRIMQQIKWTPLYWIHVLLLDTLMNPLFRLLLLLLATLLNSLYCHLDFLLFILLNMPIKLLFPMLFAPLNMPIKLPLLIVTHFGKITGKVSFRALFILLPSLIPVPKMPLFHVVTRHN